MLSIFLCALLTACPVLIFSAPVYRIPLGQSSVGEISNELFTELKSLAEIVELYPAAPPPSPFLSLPNPSSPSPNLNRRSLDKALEYFHLPKHQLEASLAEAKEVAAYEASLTQDSDDPNYVPHDREDLDDDKDLISQASSIIVYNGRAIEMDGRPTLSRRSLLGDKDRIGRRRKHSPGLGLTLKSTAPAHTALETGVRGEMADVGENILEDGVVNAQKGQNFRAYSGIPVRKNVDVGYADGVGGGVGRARRAPVKVEEGLLGKRQLTWGWGKWEPHMEYLQWLDGPAILSIAHEDDLDSGAWAGEAPNKMTKDRFWDDVELVSYDVMYNDLQKMGT